MGGRLGAGIREEAGEAVQAEAMRGGVRRPAVVGKGHMGHRAGDMAAGRPQGREGRPAGPLSLLESLRG